MGINGRVSDRKPFTYRPAPDSGLSAWKQHLTWHNAARAAVVVGCLTAWSVLAATPLPGLAPDAIARQLPDYPMRAISLARIGVQPVILVVAILYLASSTSEKMGGAIGSWETWRYPLWLAGGVLLFAAVRAVQVSSDLHQNGQLGKAAIDAYALRFGLMAGTVFTLGLGWVVATYGFETLVVRGWLFFYVVDVIGRWVFAWTSTWRHLSPHSPLEAWTFGVEALMAASILILLTLLLVVRCPIAVRVPAPEGDRTMILPLRLMKASSIVAAFCAWNFADTAYTLGSAQRIGPLADLSFSGLLFVTAVPTVLFLQRLNFSPDVVVRRLLEYESRVAGVAAGPASLAYLRSRARSSAAISAVWFATLLAAPQLIELLLPPSARLQITGVQLMLVGSITVSIYENRRAANRVTGPRWRRADDR